MDGKSVNITIIGLGLIGGSFGLSLKRHIPFVHLTGVDENTTHADRAKELGLVDELSNLYNGLKNADIVVLAVPVDGIQRLLPKILDTIEGPTVVVDLGSTKAGIAQSVLKHANRSQYVAAHPMAGTEFSGPEAALPNLYDGKLAVICDRELSDTEALTKVENLFTTIGMDLIYYQSDAHDQHLAYVSHLSHISSYALGLTVLKKEHDESAIFDMASTGFSSTVRLAKSSPYTWLPIFKQNRKEVLNALSGYIQELQNFQQLLEKGEDQACLEWMTEANEIKRVLGGIGKSKNG